MEEEITGRLIGRAVYSGVCCSFWHFTGPHNANG